jgi:exopolysaccharide production protein ExoZ
MVVYHHVEVQFERVAPAGQHLPLAWIGAAGVDIFFVVSGLLMWSTTTGRDTGPGTFMLRRIRRIVPLYWCVTLAVAALAWFVPRLFMSTRFEVTHLVASLFFIPYPSPLQPEHLWPVLVPGWTLNYEMFFYALFSLCLLAPERLRFASILGILAALVLAGAALQPKSIYGVFFTHPIMLGFAFGIVVARLSERGGIPPLAAWALIAAGGAVVASSRIEHGLAWSFGSMLVVLGFVSLEAAGRMGKSFLLGIGNASYSIYLTHVLVLPAVAKAFAVLGPVDHPAVAVLFVMASMAVATFVGLLVYRLVEAPIDRYLRSEGARDFGIPARVLARIPRRKMPEEKS